MRSKKDPRLQVIPDNSWTIESIRDATKEEIEKEYQKIKDGQDSKKFYIILPIISANLVSEILGRYGFDFETKIFGYFFIKKSLTIIKVP